MAKPLWRRRERRRRQDLLLLPAIVANDRDGEIVKGWFPGLILGAGIGF